MILRETLASNFSGGADVDISGDCKYISIAYSSGVSAFEGDGYSYNLTEVLNESQNSITTMSNYGEILTYSHNSESSFL